MVIRRRLLALVPGVLTLLAGACTSSVPASYYASLRNCAGLTARPA